MPNVKRLRENDRETRSRTREHPVAFCALKKHPHEMGSKKGNVKFRRKMCRPQIIEGIGSSGWIRTSNPPVNSRKTPDLPRVASDCAESADRESDSMRSSAIDDQKHSSDASVCRAEPRLGVSKGHRKGNAKSG